MSLFRSLMMAYVALASSETITEISSFEAVAGDVCLYSILQSKLIIVSIDDIEKCPASKYIPVGVVVVPGSHDVYGNGSCGVISLKPMNCDTPTTGGTDEQGIYWGVAGTDISGLPNLIRAPYVGKGKSVGDSTSTVIGEAEFTYLPSDNFSAVQCPHDTDTYYHSSSSLNYQAPSPFLIDGSRNPAYYQTSSPSSTSNCLADFDGRGNTDKIIAQRGVKDYSSWKPTYNTEADYPAASCCDMFYTDGTKQGDWYLPACGELGYMMVNFNKINTTINTLTNAYGVGVQLDNNYVYYWSSSGSYSGNARCVCTNDGGVSYDYNGDTDYVRAFLMVGTSY